ncbi:hypothetical protein D3C75_1138000 [compost metagenome]
MQVSHGHRGAQHAGELGGEGVEVLGVQVLLLEQKGPRLRATCNVTYGCEDEESSPA